jgi:MinD-like ATPase involved in chromosome partitioning or flagellar assembly
MSLFRRRNSEDGTPHEDTPNRDNAGRSGLVGSRRNWSELMGGRTQVSEPGGRQSVAELPGYPPGHAKAPGQLPSAGLRRLFRWRRHEAGVAVDIPTGGVLADPLNLPPYEPDVVRAVRALIPGPRVIAFINPKGGVHKTTAAVLTAATFGTLRGPGVLAWDDNELRGTLGLRAGTARHGRTIKHLLTDLPELEATGGPYPEDLDAYLRHQDDGVFDVLAADEDPKIGRLLTADIVSRLTSAVTRSHLLVLVDTGNNVDSDNWRTIVERADQLVVVTLPREDAAFAADWMLEVLVEEGFEDKVADAITIFSTPTPNVDPALLADLTEHFTSRTRAVVQAPYDPALEQGGRIEYSELRPETRDAWVHVAALIAQGL